MKRMRDLTDEEKAKIISSAHTVGDHLIGIGRSYVKSVTAPNRAENKEQEAKFKQRLGLLIVALAESGVFD